MDRELPNETPLTPPGSRPERVADQCPDRDRALSSREHSVIRERGYFYRLSPAELDTMQDIGRFRTVAIEDLARRRYQGQSPLMREDLRALRSQGLIEIRTVWSGPKSQELHVAVLTQRGKTLLQRHGGYSKEQTVYAGFVKPAEVRHDAAIYRMYHAERERLEQAGARIRRVVLDYELKQRVYSPLAKVKGLPPAQYARRQREVAQTNGLKVVHGKIPLPDLRIEYETREGDTARVDLELATQHYHGSHLQTKAEAGFTFYAAQQDTSRLSRALEDREITAVIFSL